MSQLDNGKIPKNTTCPYSEECGSCKIDVCNGRGCPVAYGKTIKHDFSCAAARGLDINMLLPTNGKVERKDD